MVSVTPQSILGHSFSGVLNSTLTQTFTRRKGPAAPSSSINREKEDFRSFYQQYSRQLWLYIRKTCADEQLADDIFQETFLKFLKSAPPNLHDSQKKAYLYKVAFHLIIDHQRRIIIEQRALGTIPGDNEPGSEHQLFLKLDMEKSFNLLKPKERTLIWLAYSEGLSHQEIARIMDLKVKSIRVLLHRAKHKFAGILRARGYEGE